MDSAQLERVLADMQFAKLDPTEASDKLMWVIDTALLAYARSRRDPNAARAVLLAKIPTIIVLDDHLRNTLRGYITMDREETRNGRDVEVTAKYLRDEEAVQRWLHGRRTAA